MMGWAAGFLGAGGAVLVGGCVIGMGVLIWLFSRLTGDSSDRVGVPQIRHDPDPSSPERRIDAHSHTRAWHQPSGAAGSGSVAP
jgi:hypothetical protein